MIGKVTPNYFRCYNAKLTYYCLWVVRLRVLKMLAWLPTTVCMILCYILVHSHGCRSSGILLILELTIFTESLFCARKELMCLCRPLYCIIILHWKWLSSWKPPVQISNRFSALQEPMKKRRQKLEDSLKWHQFNFDANSEQQWINEHRLAATSVELGKTLSDVQNLQANHKVHLCCYFVEMWFLLLAAIEGT